MKLCADRAAHYDDKPLIMGVRGKERGRGVEIGGRSISGSQNRRHNGVVVSRHVCRRVTMVRVGPVSLPVELFLSNDQLAAGIQEKKEQRSPGSLYMQ